MSERIPVMVAGVGGASLGTEVFKCLRDAGRYDVYGCDISPYAYGHYQGGFAETFVIGREAYVDSVLALCRDNGIRAVIPGGEGPLALLGPAADLFKQASVHVAANCPEVIATCSDKQKTFERLAELDLPTPQTIAISTIDDFADPGYPCIVKPASDTGGSRFVFLASDQVEARQYAAYVLDKSGTVLLQEYVSHRDGEFTVGVLSLPDGRTVGSVAMRRLFNAKLSVLMESDAGLISSGYSQGLIDDYPEVCRDAEQIARALGSTGPINIQGRLRDGRLLPFEINPRFSASTYLRALAGFNEVDIYLQYVLADAAPPEISIRPGYYLRSLDEVAVDLYGLRQ